LFFHFLFPDGAIFMTFHRVHAPFMHRIDSF
jgi:hypothetical protein